MSLYKYKATWPQFGRKQIRAFPTTIQIHSILWLDLHLRLFGIRLKWRTVSRNRNRCMFSLTSTFPRDKCQQQRQDKVKATNLYYLVSCYYNVRNEPDNPILFKYKRAVKNNRSVPRMRLFSKFYQPHIIVCSTVYQAIILPLKQIKENISWSTKAAAVLSGRRKVHIVFYFVFYLTQVNCKKKQTVWDYLCIFHVRPRITSFRPVLVRE